MARAQKEEILRPREYETVLLLTDDEASILLSVLGNVGGPQGSLRIATDAIRTALKQICVQGADITITHAPGLWRTYSSIDWAKE